MSNSHVPESFDRFIRSRRMRNLILAFNPDFSKPEYKVDEYLNQLSKTHDCFFFVLKNNFDLHSEPKVISEKHIENLKKYGIVYITETKEKKSRAEEFKQFILKNIHGVK